MVSVGSCLDESCEQIVQAFITSCQHAMNCTTYTSSFIDKWCKQPTCPDFQSEGLCGKYTSQNIASVNFP